MKEFLIQSGIPFSGEFLRLPLNTKHVKLDVGLSENAPQSAQWIASQEDVFVFGFEPVSLNRLALYKGRSKWPTQLNPNDIGRSIEIVPCALGNSIVETGIDFYVTADDPGCSSLLQPRNFQVAYKEKVPLWRLRDFLTFFPFQDISIIEHLKIDVQGADFEVIKGIGRDISKILFITVEIDVNGYFGTSNHPKKIIRFLHRRGFIRVRFSKPLLWWFQLRGIDIKFNVGDPTFVNLRRIMTFKGKQLFIYQQG
jgi:FkbM family methyltransferase